ncbi:MAG: ArgR family transcriptional regulator [Spirochaetaceae bacterium]|nr:ArgR family transcriptional regulator [Spirochaetaceae bacterium]
MRARAHRLKLIERLIEDKEVGSQDQLQEMLRIEGFVVTQATLSRDLHRLKAYRVVDEGNNLRYVISQEVVKPLDAESKSDVARGLLSITLTGNLAVVRTPANFAAVFAMAFERLALNETIGVIAGDDTVFIAVKEGTDIDVLKAAIKAKVPELKIKGFKELDDEEDDDEDDDD